MFFDLDISKINLKKEEVSIYYLTYKITEYYLKKTKINYTTYFNNLFFKIYFYPIREKETLIYPLGNSDMFNKIKEFLPEIQFYGYWNNVDPDENCSNNEWKQREKDWNRVLPGIGYLKENGLSFSLLEENINLYFCFLSKKQIEHLNYNINKYTTVENRLERLIKLNINLIISNNYKKSDKKLNFEEYYKQNFKNYQNLKIFTETEKQLFYKKIDISNSLKINII